MHLLLLHWNDCFDFEEYNKDAINESIREEYGEESSDEECCDTPCSLLTTDPNTGKKLYNVCHFNENLGLYIDMHNFIVNEKSPGIIIVIDEKSLIIPLESWEIAMTRSYGLIWEI